MRVLTVILDIVKRQKLRGLNPTVIRLDGYTYQRFKHEMAALDMPDTLIVNKKGVEYLDYMGHRLKIEHEFQELEFVINIA
jgi:anti-anti-sigma regulatory factor